MGSTSSGVLALTILKCLVVFYVVYYVSGSLCFAFFRMQSFDGRIPFNFQTWIDLGKCCGNYTPEQLVNVVSMEITFVLSGLLFGTLTTYRLWDFAITTSLVHIALSCLVMLSFPIIWSWWVCLGFAILQMVAFGEAVTFLRRKKQQVKVAPAVVCKEPQSYLYKSV